MMQLKLNICHWTEDNLLSYKRIVFCLVYGGDDLASLGQPTHLQGGGFPFVQKTLCNTDYAFLRIFLIDLNDNQTITNVATMNGATAYL